MRQPTNIVNMVNYSSHINTQATAKDVQKSIINKFFELNSATEVHENIMDVWAYFSESEIFQDFTSEHKSNLLFTINQTILLIHRLEKTK